MIRSATSDDIPALTALAQATYTAAFGHSFLPDDLTAHLERELSEARFAQIVRDDTVLVAERDGQLIGYVQLGVTEVPGQWELRRLYVRAEFQSQGVGSALMDAALSHPILPPDAPLVLDVWEHNPGAQRFYRRYGFEIVGTQSFEVASGRETSLDLLMVRLPTERASGRTQ